MKNSELSAFIDEWVNSKRNREILKERLIDGIPLDNVKAEIEAKEMVETNIERQFYNMALGDVIEIINNIGKADKE